MKHKVVFPLDTYLIFCSKSMDSPRDAINFWATFPPPTHPYPIQWRQNDILPWYLVFCSKSILEKVSNPLSAPPPPNPYPLDFQPSHKRNQFPLQLLNVIIVYGIIRLMWSNFTGFAIPNSLFIIWCLLSSFC
jgi:hypothetical protein